MGCHGPSATTKARFEMKALTLGTAVWLLLILPVMGQFSSSIEGTIIDSSNASVPGASVHVKNIATGVSRDVGSSDDGVYRALSLGVGTYRVTVEKQGFLTAESGIVTLGISATVKVDFTLKMGAVSEQVTVSAQAALLETEKGRVSNLVDSLQMKEMPLNGRDIYNLIALQPGVTGRGISSSAGTSSPGNDSFAGEASPQLYASGSRTGSNNFTVDDGSSNSVARGGVTNLTPSADSVEEVRVVANNFSAENGRNSGAQIQVITKTGTNTFHGGVSYYFQNNTLSARNIFTTTVPVFRKNQFTTNLGGPIWKNHTFFHFTYEGLRQSGGAQAQVVSVETPQFRDWVLQTRPNSIAAYLLKNFGPSVYPTYNFRDLNGDGIPDLGSAVFAPDQTRNGDQFSGRIDHELRPGKDRLYANIYRTHVFTLTGGIRTAFNSGTDETTTFVNLNETHIFGPNLLNEFGGAMMRLVGIPQPPPQLGVPAISITSDTGYSSNSYPAGWFQTNFDYNDKLSWVHGKHTIKVGGELRKNNANARNTSNYIPTYSFATILTFANDQPYQMVRNVDPSTGTPVTNYSAMRVTEFALFVNDDWKVARNFTITLGLRYENYGTITDATGILRNLVLGTGSDFQTRLANAKAEMVPQFYPADNNNFAPRFGFAWDVGGKAKTVVRGGFGVSYDRMYTVTPGNFRAAPPLRAQATLGSQFGTTFTYSLGDPTQPYLGYPVDPSLRMGLDAHNGIVGIRVAYPTGIDQNVRSPYVYNWFYGIQRDLGHQTVLEVNYIGTAGHKLLNYANVNRFAGDLLNNNQFHGFNQSFSQINWVESSSNSIYQGGTVQVKRAFQNNFTLQGAFTFGKVLTDSEDFSVVTPYQDVWNQRADRSVANFDVPRRLAVVGVWNAPQLAGAHRALRYAFGGWQFAGSAILEAGLPLNVTTSAPWPTGDFNADGSGGDRPNAPAAAVRRGGWLRTQFQQGMFKVSDFPTPTPGTDGDLGRDAFRGPGFANVDASLAKKFQFTERVSGQLRLDAFNTLNRVNLANPVMDLANINFGRATSTAAPRALQMGLRVMF